MPTIPLAAAFCTALLLVTAVPRQAGKKAAPAENLARNGGFEGGAAAGVPNEWFHAQPSIDAGYQVSVSKDKPQAGAACAVLAREAAGAGAQGFGNFSQTADVHHLRGKRVRLRAAVRAQVAGTNNQAQLWLRIDRKGDQRGFFDNMGDRGITSDKWQHYEIVGDVADDAERLIFGLLLVGSGSAAIDDVSLTVVDASVPTTGAVFNTPGSAPGLTEIEMAVAVSGDGDTDAVTYLYPLPLAYRDQVALTFHLTVTPAAAGQSVTIVEGAGDNRVLKLALQGLKDHREVTIVYRAAVLVAPTSFDGLPATARFPAQWPAEARPWLQSTWCCEHENERVKQLATEIRGKSVDVREVITKVLARAKTTVAAAEGRVTELTAVQALDKQGSCTSCANLVAALLRGCGVPARILSGYPLWSGPLQTHYIVEAYVPKWGWYPVESTMGREPWPNHEQINVSIVPVEHESRKLAGARRCAGGAVPYLSLTEIEEPEAGVRSVGTLKPHCDHEARMVRPFTASDQEWAAAVRWGRERWTRWLASKPELRDGSLRFGPETGAITAATLAELRKALK